MKKFIRFAGGVFLVVIMVSCASGGDQDDNTPIDGESGYKVSEAVYERTFSEVGEVIQSLNKIISEEDYEQWVEYLTPEYIASITDEENLEALNNSTLLKRNSIVLEDLEDYFQYVVVPSRTGLRLDDLVFIDDNTVQAIMIIRDQRAILYLLRRVRGRWRISV